VFGGVGIVLIIIFACRLIFFKNNLDESSYSGRRIGYPIDGRN
jgi:hypothetical protein